MAETEIIPKEVAAQVEEIGSADLLLCLPVCSAAGDLEAAATKVQQILPTFSSEFTAVLVAPVGLPLDIPANGKLRTLELSQLVETDPMVPASRLLPKHRRTLFAISRTLKTRACAVLETDLQNTAAEDIFGLIHPVLGRNQDLVIAAYQRRRFDTLINTAIVGPLLRSLYGKQVQSPLARDFSVSPRLVERYFAALSSARSQTEEMSPAWIVTEAIVGGFQVCQAFLQTRPETPQTGADLSTILAQLLSPLFAATERDAPFWQKLRGAQPVPTFGSPGDVADEQQSTDVGHMVDSFRLGLTNLREVWSLVLSPASILELKKMALLAPDRFQMPDSLWARIVYDFALAFHSRTINRDHLLRALTPAYLAWVASYAIEAENLTEAGVVERVEKLSEVYVKEKPYFLSRWRWPDRFSP